MRHTLCSSLSCTRHTVYQCARSTTGALKRRSRKFSTDPVVEAVVGCLKNWSVEVTPAAARKVKNFAAVPGLKPGTSVNVTYLVGSSIDDSVQVCERLSHDGLNAVAHVPARSFKSLDEVDHYLKRLSEVGVREVLVLGGGADSPTGQLHESMQILESGLLQKYGMGTIGVAAHPEGHPDISSAELLNALVRKAEWAKFEGVELYYETQFCFEASPIVDWEGRARAALVERLGAETPLPEVRLGVAGPAKIANLIKFGTMSGVGASLSFFSKYAGNVMKLATTAAPDTLIAGIAAHQTSEENTLIRAVHFYPFGGFSKTVKWAAAVESGAISVSSGVLPPAQWEEHGFALEE